MNSKTTSKDLVFGGSNKAIGGVSINLYATEYEWMEYTLSFSYQYGEKVFEGLESCELVDPESN